jgi:hypothetical protein
MNVGDATEGTGPPNTMSPTESGDDHQKRQGWVQAMTSTQQFRPHDAISPAAMLDAGLPLAIFTVVYAVAGHDLTLSLWAALGAGGVLAMIRLVRRERLQNVLAGFLGLALAAYIAHRTGRAEDVFLPGLLINMGYGVAYLVSIMIRWPLLGVIVGVVTGQGTSWRRDPALLRAYTKASLLWLAMFAARLAVQVPLYVAGVDHLGWLAGARLVMSWPLFLLVAYLSWVIIRPAYTAHTATSPAELPTVTPPQ